METVNISSGMAHFRLIARILETSPNKITGEVKFEAAPVYLGLEAMAQLAALHVRRQVEFDRHAFLLGVQECQMPDMALLTGRYKLNAVVISQSSHASLYETLAQGTHRQCLTGKLLIGTRHYDDHFPKEGLKAYYQKRWTELKV